jgi:hypothetical protein
MGQYLLDHHRVLNAGNHLHRATAFTAGLDVDVENPLEALRPVHHLRPLYEFSCSWWSAHSAE